MARDEHAAEDDGCQKRNGKQAPQHTQLLADDGKNEVRVPGRQAPGVLGLGLGAVEQALARELAASQSQEAAGLLPAHAPNIQIVVKEGHEPLLHIGVDLICLPQDIKGEAAAQNTDNKPPLGHSRHKAHAGEDKNKHQGAAHVAGHRGIDPNYEDQVSPQHGDGRDGLEITVFLQIYKLPGQQKDEGDFHDLRRLQAHRDALHAQPGSVAAGFHAQGGLQQQNQNQTTAQEPFPVLADLSQVQHAHEHIGYNAQAQSCQLDNDIFIRARIVGGAGNHQAAEKGCARAEGKQHQVYLAEAADKNFPYFAQHMAGLLSWGESI